MEVAKVDLEVDADGVEEKEEKEKEKENNKFNNSHLAGGESTSNFFTKKLIIKLYLIYNIVPILNLNKIYLIRKNNNIFKIIISN